MQHYGHEALPYAGDAAFVDMCSEVVHDGLARDERMIVLASAHKLDALGAALGAGVAEDLSLVAIDDHGRNPARIMTMLHSFQAAGDGRHCVGLKETTVPGRSAAGRDETRLSEFLLNDPSLRSWPLSVVCLYNTDALEDDCLGSMRQSHPTVRGLPDNPEYRPDEAAVLCAADLGAAPSDARQLSVGAADLTALRGFVRDMASGFGLTADRTDDLVLAANEIVTNSLRYGGGQATVTMWVADGAAVCDVRDRGRLQNLLAGRIPPVPSATSGRGLWLANHLCDLVQVRSSAPGTVVRMHVER